MGTLGGDLKRKEKITGRFADIFSWMYLATAVLRRFEAEGRRQEDLPFLHWSMAYALDQCQQGFDGLFKNLRLPGLTWLVRGPMAAWSRLNRLSAPPADALGAKIARACRCPASCATGSPPASSCPPIGERALGRLDHAFELCYRAERVVRKIKKAIRARRLPKAPAVEAGPRRRLAEGIIDADEADLLRRAAAAREDAIQVDSFTLEEYRRSAVWEEAVGPIVEDPAEPVSV